MEQQLREFEAATKEAFCNAMEIYAGNLQYVVPILLGGTIPGRAVSLALSIATWAAENNCNWDTNPTPDDSTNLCGATSIKGTANEQPFYLSASTGANSRAGFFAVELLKVSKTAGTGNNTKYVIDYVQIEDNKRVTKTTEINTPYDDLCFYFNYPRDHPSVNGWCGEDPIPKPPPPLPPHTYITEQNCEMSLTLMGFAQEPSGAGGPVYLIESKGNSLNRESAGGIIGGCNFAPTIYYSPGGGQGGGGGGVRIPYIDWEDDDGKPFWQELLERALPVALGNLIADALKELFKTNLPPAEFLFVAPCDKDSDDKPLEVLYELPQQNYQSRVVSQQAVIMEILQQHLNWKTPVCFGYEGKGDYRTISFISEELSSDGNDRLRKRFRYRSQSGNNLDAVIDHWKDFTFRAGPVCVQHRGSTLGSPQVWAASAAEGKRVIFHAAREAGVDPDQAGEWSIGGSDNPRYGMSGKMIVNTKGGYYWITSRLGENNRPLVGSINPPDRGVGV